MEIVEAGRLLGLPGVAEINKTWNGRNFDAQAVHKCCHTSGRARRTVPTRKEPLWSGQQAAGAPTVM